MTILVTGSAGHLGEAIVRTLKARGQNVRGIDILASPFTARTGSIADRGFVDACMVGVTAVIHCATLHKPHVATHSYAQFVETNITGTLNLLEAARATGVGAFVFTSTTSTFGDALSPAVSEPAAWIDEDVVPIPKNIYGVTKLAAEGLCELFARKHGLPVVVLRTSRFFPEADDDAAVRARFGTENLQAVELLYRRVDIADAVEAHLLAVERAAGIGFGRYVVSATTPFVRDDLVALREDLPGVLRRLYPGYAAAFAAKDWRVPDGIDRVYVNARAVTDLGWRPRYDFHHVLDSLAAGEDFRSELARAVGAKGYHAVGFGDVPYPVVG